MSFGTSTLQHIFHPGLNVAQPLPAHGRGPAPMLDSGVRAAVADAVERADVTRLMRLLQFDPLSTARCLRVANSPFFSRGRHVASAGAALDVLGGRTLAMIALVSSFDYRLGRKWSGQLDFLRRHSIQTAIMAEQIVRLAGWSGHAEEAFVAGLLHDIHPMFHYRDDVSNATVSECALRSARLLRGWNLPVSIVDAISDLGAERRQRASRDPLGTVLRIAHQLATGLDGSVEDAIRNVRSLEARLQLPAGMLEEAARITGARVDAMELGG